MTLNMRFIETMLYAHIYYMAMICARRIRRHTFWVDLFAKKDNTSVCNYYSSPVRIIAAFNVSSASIFLFLLKLITKGAFNNHIPYIILSIRTRDITFLECISIQPLEVGCMWDLKMLNKYCWMIHMRLVRKLTARVFLSFKLTGWSEQRPLVLKLCTWLKDVFSRALNIFSSNVIYGMNKK